MLRVGAHLHDCGLSMQIKRRDGARGARDETGHLQLRRTVFRRCRGRSKGIAPTLLLRPRAHDRVLEQRRHRWSVRSEVAAASVDVDAAFDQLDYVGSILVSRRFQLQVDQRRGFDEGSWGRPERVGQEALTGCGG
jgi:hypothetical protein